MKQPRPPAADIPAPAARPMPPRPASGGEWTFDADLWAYVRPALAGPAVEAGVQRDLEAPFDKEPGK